MASNAIKVRELQSGEHRRRKDVYRKAVFSSKIRTVFGNCSHSFLRQFPQKDPPDVVFERAGIVRFFNAQLSNYSLDVLLFQVLYDAFFLTLYNSVFTSLPILAYGLFEQNVRSRYLLENPWCYR